jgi:peptide/nickel transport system permease protein
VRKWSGKYVIGLTGNLATGKSVVRKMLEHLGAYGIDADVLSRRVISQGAPGYLPVISTFGRRILDDNSKIDYRKLGELVFNDPEASAQLDAIIHPCVIQAIDLLIRRARQKIIVIESNTLLESDLAEACDSIWTTYAPENIQQLRLVNKRGWSEAESQKRIHMQPSRKDKIARSSVVIQNAGSFEDTWNQTLAAWKLISLTPDTSPPLLRNADKIELEIQNDHPGYPQSNIERFPHESNGVIPLASNDQNLSEPPRTRAFIRTVQYLARKLITISVTVFIGVLITVMIANQPSRRGLGPPVSPFETSLEAQINLVVQTNIFNGTIGRDSFGVPIQSQVKALTDQLRNEAGLNLPNWQRYLGWTIKALTFDWGQLGNRQGGWGAQKTTASANDIIIQYLPNTLLLVTTTYLLVFLIGMPLSLYLARNRGNWADRLFAILSPISSVPSWVFGIILISIFAFQLRWLPFGGMFESSSQEDPIRYVLDVSKHMILPVSAFVLSLLFQLVYAWRTFFVIYSEEDYVQLAQAKGLSSRILNKQYILKPALPYILTSFVTSLISFWQLSMALEAVFRWPGLGWLYIKEALPNFWGETMEPGELIIAIGIVVIFAYLLGIVVFLLDLAYVIVDPRIRLFPENKRLHIKARVKSGDASWWKRFKKWRPGKGQVYVIKVQDPIKNKDKNWSRRLSNLKGSLIDLHKGTRLFSQELRRYPSAIFGLAVITILLVGSIYAVTAYPYDQVGKDYEQKRLLGRSFIPRTAMPKWANLFSNPPKLSTLIMNPISREANVSIINLPNGWIEKTTTFTFDYPYKEIPSDIFLYFDPVYKEKAPFITLEWKYPDGRVLELKRTIAEPSSSYDFETSILPNKLLKQNPEWNNWFDLTGQYSRPVFTLLFAKPNSPDFSPQNGTYQLTVKILLLEQDSDVLVQFVLLGQVYGMAGTDFARRDLMVPLFWGMPFALLIGLMGSLVTTLVSMLLPAIGVWYGGWVDNLIQRLAEINMVLPGLAIAVLANVLFNINIWIILGIVVLINAFGSPLKIIRSALLQAKEAPYIESARAYGASNFRIIAHYLMPRILPVLIPQLVTQVPSFIFWEATLGFFNIKSNYPTWGRIIYDGLSRGALYGSPFWVLEPIFLLLLTSLAFAMLGSALERVLNPRTLESVPLQNT